MMVKSIINVELKDSSFSMKKIYNYYKVHKKCFTLKKKKTLN